MNRSRVTGNLSSHGNIFVDIANDRVGIGSTIPTAKLDVGGNAQIGGANEIVGTPYNYFYGRGSGASGVSVYAAEAALELVGSNAGSHGSSLLFRTAGNDGIGFNYNTGSNTLELKSFDATGNNFQIHASGSNVSNLKDILKAVSGGAVELYHNNAKTFSTNSTGISVYQRLVCEGTAPSILFSDTNHQSYTLTADANIFTISDANNGDRLKFNGNGSISALGFLNCNNTVYAANGFSTNGNIDIDDDNDKLRIGASDDLQLYHTGSHTHIDNLTGFLALRSDQFQVSTLNGTHVYINVPTDEQGVELYYDNVKRFETTSTGASVTGNITGTGDLTLTDTTADSAAGPEFKLFRNSASPADADYLGQIKFAGESDTGVERNYAKITGKILDASNGTEDGIIEFAHIKAGSQTITGRWRSDSLQLLNGTSLTVAGTAEITGLLTANGSLDVTGNIDSTVAGGNNQLKIETTSSGDPSIYFAASGSGGHNIEYIRSSNTLNFKQAGGSVRLSITAAGHLLPGTDSQYNIGSNTVRFANIYADTLYGDGSNLTGITQTAINNNADNRVITGSGTANTLNAESGLTYDGTTLQIAAADDIRIAGGTWTGEYTGGIKIQPDGSNSYIQHKGTLFFRDEGSTNNFQLTQSGNLTISGSITATGGFSGSGASLTSVNATTLDSIDSGSFLRSDASDAVTNYNHNIEFHSNTAINTGSGNQASLEVYQSTSQADAFMSFHVSGDFACYLGLDGGTNKMSIGGWSMGANSYAIYHEGNNPTFSQLGITASNINALGINATTLDSIDSGSFLRSDAADTTTERVSFHACNTHNYDTIATSSGSQGALEVYNQGSGNDAFMTFHAGSDFAFYFGLDADTNDLSVGGWSMGAAKYRVWHAGNDGSGSGLDADTLDGYNQSDSAGNNTIVRRNSSGYVFANYFNTTTDDTGTAADVTRFYCSQDQYIRYIDKTSMRSVMNVSANSRAYGGRETSTSDTNYWIGSTGWGTTGFDTLWNYGSCFFDTWSNPSGQPSGTSHWTGMQAMHYNAGAKTNSYGFRIVAGAGQPALAYIGGQWGASEHSFVKLWNAANDGSGSGLDADLLDGVQGSNYLRSDQSDTLSGTLTVTYGVHLTNNNSWSGETCKVVQHSNYLYMVGGSNGHVFRRSNGYDCWYINSNGHLYPAANDTYDLGTSGNRIRNIYTSDLNMSNEGSQNDVDGTWGSYTIQEGEDDLFLINRRSGKKYKFNLTEVS